MSNQSITDTELIKKLEKQIYQAYYKKNPDGDAHLVLWPKVLDAIRAKDIQKLKLILEEL